MRLTRPSALTILTLVLIVILPSLAVVQYRWVGQVNDAERERMQRNLRTAAQQFRNAFDSETTRALFSLRVDAASIRENTWDRYAVRYEDWTETAADARIVANVFLVDVMDEELRLRRWNAATHTFESAEWPERLAAWRPLFDAQRAGGAAGARIEGRSPIPDDDELLVAPALNPFGRARGRREDREPVFGFTILQLDMHHIRSEVLPALVQRHFSGAGGDSYRVAVATRDDPPRIVYQSHPETPVDPLRADASEPLHGTYSDPGGLFGPRRDRNGRPRVDGRTNVIVELFDGDGRPAAMRRIINRDAGRWMLFVQHESGSLEAAVAALRRRNLAISFGTLLLLTVSVALMAISSRRAHRLAQQQVEFVAGVSHELRTPVAVIRSAAQNLSEGVVGSAERVKRYGATIEAEARRLGDMIERVLQYGGVESRAPARGLVAPQEIVTAAIDAAAPALGAAQVDRRVADGLPAVLGDTAALRSAVENLLVNAAKYGGNGWVGVTVEREGNARRPAVRITVEDHGPGIPPSELPHIFEPFYRGADAIARQVQGSGLGLTLVNRIVTSHGGRVDVASRPGGTSFTITLPAAEHA